MSISVVYWSGTGNTKTMAEAVARGIEVGGGEARILAVSETDAGNLAKEKVFALGCPSMGAEELEETEMEPFVQELENKISGKTILLFGSYGWGDGEWMRTWEERMKTGGADVAGGAGIIANETPDAAALAECEEAGKILAAEAD